MSFTNLPGVFHEKQDKGLAILAASNAPRILVLGTASKGPSTPWVVGRTQEAAVLFGSDGTLIRGMYEAKAGGGEQVVLLRVGATAAVLEGIGVNDAAGGVTITTGVLDDSAGTDYSMYWDNTSGNQRLVVKNVESDVIVYDRDYSLPTATTDLGEVFVSGVPVDSEGSDIGDQYNFLTLFDVSEEVFVPPDDGVTLTPGTDGTTPSRMKLYEYLYNAYLLLENQDFDYVVPMDVYLDDDNVADGDTFSAVPSATYPVKSSADDILLYFYAEEYNGEWMFWWRKTKLTGNPDIYPSLTYATESPSGVDLATTAFHEVNFAHQLGMFCHTISENSNECIGFIGVKPPVSIGMSDVKTWLGKLPTYTVDSSGNATIASAGDDGTGLLGNKFMAGKYGFRANVAYGGFIATEDGFLDGTELEDRGGNVIDIGKYLNLVGQWSTLYNSFDTFGLGYIAPQPTTYCGFVSTLDPKSAPTNKVIAGTTLPFRINNTTLDSLAGLGYVFYQSKPKGIVVADAPTAARPDSDYRRLTTVRICKEVIDAIRAVADPFIGEAGGAPQRAALQTAIEGALGKLQKGGYIQRYELSITQTAAERVNGFATVELALVPAFELRQITLVISLRSV